jgi:molybdopterin-guanine dinucleotide biosynthesis protein A
MGSAAAYTRFRPAPAAGRRVSGSVKLVGLLEELLVRVVTAEEIEAFEDSRRRLANVNTPAEYGDLEAFQGHHL